MSRNLSSGMTGADVRILQDRLNYHLRRETPLKVDGIFGPRTAERARKFQTLHALKADGIVGPRTKAILYEVDTVTAQVLFFPKLTPPTFGTAGASAIKPPQLIPPLTLPSAPKPQPFVLQPPVILGPQLTLSGVSSQSFSPVRQPSLLNLTFTLVPVQDPSDPVVRSTQNLVKAVEKLPGDSKFTAMIVSMIPKPVKTISEPTPGLDVDIGIPKYSPLDPNKISQSGSVQYNLKLTGRPGGATPLVFLQGRAEGEIEIDYTGKAQSNYFKATATCNFFLGVVGTF